MAKSKKSRPTASPSPSGAAIEVGPVGIVVALVAIGLVGAGIWWMVRGTAAPPVAQAQPTPAGPPPAATALVAAPTAAAAGTGAVTTGEAW